MKIQAYQDPVSKRLFATKAELTKFLSEQSALAEAAADQKGSSAKLEELKSYLVDNLTHPAELAQLAEKYYVNFLALNQLKASDGCKRKKPNITIMALRCGGLKIYSRRTDRGCEDYLSLAIEVIFSSEPPSNLLFDVHPHNVLKPFTLDGGGSAFKTPGGQYGIDYLIKAKISDLPRMKVGLDNHTELLHLQSLHNFKIEEVIVGAEADSSAMTKGIAEIIAKTEALAISKKRYEDAVNAVDEESARIRQKVTESMPFARQIDIIESNNHFGEYFHNT
jgi:hypothetical protein